MPLTTTFERFDNDVVVADGSFVGSSKLNVKFVAPPLGLRSIPRILLGLNKQCVELADFNLVMNSSPESFESSCEQSSKGGKFVLVSNFIFWGNFSC